MANTTEWQLAGAQAAYPFSTESLSKLPSGESALLSRIFLDASLVLDSRSTSASLVSAAVRGSALNLAVTFSSGLTATGTADASGLCRISDARGYSRGAIVLSEEAAALLAAKDISLQKGQLLFDATVGATIPAGILESISFGGVPFSGRVHLVEGDGIRLVSEPGSIIRVDAIGRANNLDNECPPFYSRPLKGFSVTVTGGLGGGTVLPSPYGDIVLLPGPYATPATESSLQQLLRVTPQGSGLQLSLIA